ncbi:hypothetical protein KQY27_03265 [Methanobrevibacter sp. TMH8]|uniref:hypothetical protein n=1 Tax=Methanobrevibacter sp. TMH8 TaxID=2848611 RepID=UPI001CCAD35F|nr:hypothetical protein [Methanobrevibacter sp. TMH8]MBZ9570564.1 hypothetical protein [Methanobrevibacter sp. TMH8]
MEIEDRKITKYQQQYINYLNKKRITESTKIMRLAAFRCLFNEYNVNLPKNHKFNLINYRIRNKNLPTWNDVRNSLEYCKTSRDKAIISFLATSGLRESDILGFTIKDMINATSIYHNGSLKDLLSKNPKNIVPCWDFYPLKTRKRGNLCITFNTGECTQFIFQHLKERLQTNELITPKSPLFYGRKKPHFLTTDSIIKLCQRLNKELKLGKDINRKYGKFRAQNLRKLFSTTCRRNITNVVINRNKFSELDIISIFTGHTPPNMSNSEVYDAVEDDNPNSYLRKNYESLIPYLTIFKDETNNEVKNNNQTIESEILKIKESVDILLNNKNIVS